MWCRFGSDAKRGLRGERGVVAVEFALILPVFLLLVFGIADFGHAWYMQQTVTNASREGARYGTRYSGSPASALSPSIASWISSKYSSLLPPDANLQVLPGGAGYTSGSTSDDLSVRVTATKNWWVLGNLVPGFGTTKDIKSITWMKIE